MVTIYESLYKHKNQKAITYRNTFSLYFYFTVLLIIFLMSILCSICSGVLTTLMIDGSAAAAVLWILAAVILFTAVGPLVFTAKLMKAMNKMNGDYNIHG